MICGKSYANIIFERGVGFSMATNNVILYEKYVTNLKKEKAFSIGDGTQGGLYLTEDGVFFTKDNTFLSALANFNTGNEHVRLDAIRFADIQKVEVGSFKCLFRQVYTLRIYLKNGQFFSFLMPSQEIAHRWEQEILRLSK